MFRTPGIYAIRNTINGKVYVGMSSDVQRRWYEHRKKLRKGTHQNPHLQSAWVKYGESVFRFEILQVESDLVKLPSLEGGYISRLKATEADHGYNLCSGGSIGYIRSPETRAKIGAANRGKTRTPEMRAHMREIKKGQGKGRIKSPEEVLHLKASLKGRGSPSLETIEKIRAAKKGIPWSSKRRLAQERKRQVGLVL